MVKFEHCFYCGVLMTFETQIAGVPTPDTAKTADHVIPKRMRPKKLQSRWADRRCVEACHKCNHIKGDKTVVEFVAKHIDPLRWPVIDWDRLYRFGGTTVGNIGGGYTPITY